MQRSSSCNQLFETSGTSSFLNLDCFRWFVLQAIFLLSCVYNVACAFAYVNAGRLLGAMRKPSGSPHPSEFEGGVVICL